MTRKGILSMILSRSADLMQACLEDDGDNNLLEEIAAEIKIFVDALGE